MAARNLSTRGDRFGSPEEGLAHFARRFADFVAAVDEVEAMSQTDEAIRNAWFQDPKAIPDITPRRQNVRCRPMGFRRSAG